MRSWLEVLTRFGGHAESSDDGKLVYVFPKLQAGGILFLLVFLCRFQLKVEHLLGIIEGQGRNISVCSSWGWLDEGWFQRCHNTMNQVKLKAKQKWSGTRAALALGDHHPRQCAHQQRRGGGGRATS